MKKIFMMVHELDVNKGGMTSSMFNRSKEFYDADIPADIVTFDYKGNYDEIIKALKKQGKMDRRTKMYLSILNKFQIINILSLINCYINIFQKD